VARWLHARGAEDVMTSAIRFIRIGSIALIGLAAAPLAACSQSAAAQEMPAQNESASKSEGSHSAEGVIRDVLGQLNLRQDQQSEVDKLLSDAKARHEPVRAAKRELMGALADQVERGDIDRCALNPQISKIASAVAKAYPEDRAAFEKFHSILDPDQRTKFVDAMKEKREELRKEHNPKAMLDAIGKGLNLSEDQKSRLTKVFGALKEIREANPHHGAHREEMKKIMEAFKGDQFDLDQIAPAKDIEKHVTMKMRHVLEAKEAALPILNDQQRATAAKFLRDKSEQQHGGEAADEVPME
jgi:Spy/CpxP family protein refolding chaperone